MAETIVMPPRIHCPDPANSGWLNCAMPPLPKLGSLPVVRRKRSMDKSITLPDA